MKGQTTDLCRFESSKTSGGKPEAMIPSRNAAQGGGTLKRELKIPFPVMRMHQYIPMGGFKTTCLLAVSFFALFSVHCSTDSYFYRSMNRQAALAAKDPGYFHSGESSSERDLRLMDICLSGPGRSAPPYDLSDAALMCLAEGDGPVALALLDQAIQEASGLDRRRIGLNRLIALQELFGGFPESEIGPVLTDLNHRQALELIDSLSNKGRDRLADRLYAFMVTRSSGTILAEVLLQKGEHDFGLGRNQEALVALEKSLEIRPNAEAHRLLGNIYDRANENERAIEHLEEYYKAKPSAEVAFLLARNYYRLKNAKSALTWIQKADASDAEAIQLHGDIRLTLNSDDDPRALLRALKVRTQPACAQESFLDGMNYCIVGSAYAALRPAETKAAIMRHWFGDYPAEQRGSLLPYQEGY
ncbi:MAG: tetratricopeptide repeat protein [Leptospiraceae bacterium]|nr:tetratricopeptide repeat protein [Leptospiraceae bacterium]